MNRAQSLAVLVIAMVATAVASAVVTASAIRARAQDKCEQLGGVVALLPASGWECVGVQMEMP